jgi:rhodanese-related sulfurtransferase
MSALPGPNAITPQQLARLVGTPDAPAVIDLRIAADFDADPRLIPGSERLAHDQTAAWAPRFAGRRCVAVCARGRKLSEGVAALLRLSGAASAEVLEGGFAAWAASGLPAVPAAALPPGRLWVTRHRPKIDRIACPWLIRRFLDPAARFLFVAPTEVPAVAAIFGATAFDTEDAPYTHRGALCTFDTLLDDFGLRTEALDRLSLVVRGADTDRHDLAPQAAGLLAISVGLSRQYRCDLEQLEAGMAIYDALYRWARDGHDEGHDWPAGRSA